MAFGAGWRVLWWEGPLIYGCSFSFYVVSIFRAVISEVR